MGEEGRFNGHRGGGRRRRLEDEVVASVRRTLEGDGVEVLTGTEITEETQSEIAQSLSFITRIFLVFAIIALVVGGFVIYNSFAIIVAQRTREMALLRAVGASKRQVRLAVLARGGGGRPHRASVVGVLLGLGLATLFGHLPPAARQLAGHPARLGAGVAVGVVVTVVSAYLPGVAGLAGPAAGGHARGGGRRRAAGRGAPRRGHRRGTVLGVRRRGGCARRQPASRWASASPWPSPGVLLLGPAWPARSAGTRRAAAGRGRHRGAWPARTSAATPSARRPRPRPS